MPIRNPGPIAALIAFALFLLTACEPLPPSGPGGPSGLTAELRVSGANTVRHNGAPARYGQPFRSGDSVSTGDDASALVVFSDGTTVQLDERSGPATLSWRGDELVIDVHGSFVEYVKGAAFSVVRVIGDLYDALAESHFVLEMERGRFSRFDLFEGRLRLLRPANPRPLRGGDYVRITRGASEPEFGRTSPAYARRLLRRFDRWDFAAAPPARPPVVVAPCPVGTRWNGERCERVQRPEPRSPCAAGQRWDPIEQICVCPPDRPYLQNNQCIACIGGMVWNGRQCACPPETRWNGRQCLRQIDQPPRGTILQPLQPLILAPQIICPAGEVWSPEAGKCLYVVQ